MSKIEQIEAFISVVEENGFGAAARKKDVSTAALSRQIQRLESELKVDLFKRSTRKISLTEVGEEYYQQCKKILADLKNVENNIFSSQQEATGILNVLSNRYFAQEFIVPKLSDFMKNNPNLKIKLELAERFPNFDKEGIDIVFGVSVEGPLELVRKRVGTTRYILCAAPDYLKKYGMPKIPSDIKTHRCIAHSMRNPDNVIKFKDKKAIYVDPLMWLNDTQTMCECAINGMGIVWLHDYVVKNALQAGKLVEILGDFQEPEQFVYLYYQKSRYLQPKIRRFIDFYAKLDESS